MPTFGERLRRAWNVFTNSNPYDSGTEIWSSQVSTYRPDRPRYTRGNERSIINAIYTRIALDISQIDIKHIILDDKGRFKEEVKDSLNDCLTLEANADQSSRAFKQDIVMTMFDEGCVAIVPVDIEFTSSDKTEYDILSMRTGKIIEWRPSTVRVRLYNEKTGQKEEVVIPKSRVAIVENPFYSVMNEPNSVLKRLIRKLNMLDSIDEQSSSGKLDLIIQLPYAIKTEARRQQAEERRKEIEMQLAGSKYGIAYVDGTEHITQLNRSLENNLMKQIEYLTNMLYGQLGITEKVLDGTADEQTNINYEQKTIVPIVSTIVDEMKRKFISKRERVEENESIDYFRDPFKLVPVSQLAEMADKFTRNEIMSSNEIRQKVGMKPVDDPHADELRNKNLNAGEGQTFANTKDSANKIQND